MSTDLGIGYSLLTKKDTPATGDAKERRKEAVQQELFATMPSDSVSRMTAEQAQDAWQHCYTDFKAQLGLSGADVWFMNYQDGVVTFNYDRHNEDLATRLTTPETGERFMSIVKSHFGQDVSVSFRQS